MREIGFKKGMVLFLVLVLISATAITDLAQAQKKVAGKTVNINKATAEEIAKSVPLVPLSLAKKIVQYRQEVGTFQSLEELLQVEGFDKKFLNRVKPFLLLEGLGGGDCTC
jgi:competence ComEA-like helix-hairpin-helix protein